MEREEKEAKRSVGKRRDRRETRGREKGRLRGKSRKEGREMDREKEIDREKDCRKREEETKEHRGGIPSGRGETGGGRGGREREGDEVIREVRCKQK